MRELPVPKSASLFCSLSAALIKSKGLYYPIISKGLDRANYYAEHILRTEINNK